MKLKGSFNLDLESAQMGPESSWAGVYHVTCLLNSHFTIACIWGIHLRNTFEIILAAISWYKILKLVSCDMFACQPFHNRLHWKIILPPIYWSKCLRYWSQRTRRMMAFHFYFPFASFFFPACPLFKQVIFHPLSATWFKIIWDLLFRIRDLRLRIQNLWFKIDYLRLRIQDWGCRPFTNCPQSYSVARWSTWAGESLLGMVGEIREISIPYFSTSGIREGWCW